MVETGALTVLVRPQAPMFLTLACITSLTSTPSTCINFLAGETLFNLSAIQRDGDRFLLSELRCGVGAHTLPLECLFHKNMSGVAVGKGGLKLTSTQSMVERAKKCLDFTATLYITHLFFCIFHTGEPVEEVENRVIVEVQRDAVSWVHRRRASNLRVVGAAVYLSGHYGGAW
eukprot:5526625-Pyramimonas_sp.AAC.1